MKHRQQICDLELQQDNRVAEALCDHWKVSGRILYFLCVHILVRVYYCVFLYRQKLRAHWSKRLGELSKEVFLTSVPAQSELSTQRCEELWLDLEQELAAQLQQAECITKLQLEDMRAQLDKDGQVHTIWQIVIS